MAPSLRQAILVLAASLLLTACGEDSAPVRSDVAPEQIAASKEHGVPVAFENDLGMRFVLIPAGTFRMGSPTDEEARFEDETPHEVTISQPFYLSIHEVTIGVFRAFQPDHAGVVDAEDERPMVEVSWDEASKAAEWLSERDSTRTYRLPTEAEWELACRAETTTPFWWGPTATSAQGNYDTDGTYVRGPVGPDRRGTSPVGSFGASPWGLYDMHGNVLEWCADWYAPYADDAVLDPTGPSMPLAPQVTTWIRTGEDMRRTSAKARVQRGGGWNQLPRFCRSAARLRSLPTDRQDYVGFRLVSPLPAPGAP